MWLVSSALEEFAGVVTREFKDVNAFLSSEITGLKNLLASNQSNAVEEVTSNVTRELKEVKAFQSSEITDVKNMLKKVKNLHASNPSVGTETSNQPLVGALICE